MFPGEYLVMRISKGAPVEAITVPERAVVTIGGKKAVWTVRREAAAGPVVYTCVMHPEVHQGKPGKCPKCGMRLEPRKKR